MKTKNLRVLGSTLALAALLGVVTGSAQAGGRHPRYLHARSDLRVAQLLLQVRDEPNVMRHVRQADYEIGRAIYEIDRAAVLDHKDIEDRPHIDANTDRHGRFNKVMALLVSARRDIGQEEDNPRAIEWRNAAYRHIDTAMEQMRKAARELKLDRLEGY